MKKAIAFIFVLLMVLFSVSGCRSVEEKVAEKVIEKAAESKGEDVDVDLSEEGVTIKSDEGELNIGEGAELPDGFPDVVPINPDLQIVTSWKSTEEGKENFAVSALYDKGSGNEIFNWYKNELVSSGWEITNEYTVDSGDEGKSSSLQADNGGYDLVVVVMDTEEEVSVMISVTEQ